jgi:TonB family protein
MNRSGLTIAAIAAALGWALLPATSMAADAAGGAVARPRPKLPVESAITSPDWVSLPSAEQLAAYYPKLAEVLNLAGLATMSCEVTATGALAECKILKETPAGIGFGDAALEMSKYFRMRPKTVDGEAVGGATVIVPLNFTLPPQPPQGEPTADAPGPRPLALALARRVVAAQGLQAQATRYFSGYVENTRDELGSSADTPQAALALQTYASSGEAASSQFADTVAKAYARNYTLPQLKALVVFFESPTGRAWTATEMNDKSRSGAIQAMMRRAQQDATQALCKTTQCPPADLAKP